MRREHFNLEVSNVDWIDDGDPRKPVLSIRFEGDASTLRDRLVDSTDEPLDARDIDITVRLHGSPDDRDADGVVAVTNRITGEYVFELNIGVGEILTFITAARRYGERTEDTARYCARMTADDEEIVAYEKRTLLVYGSDGELLRQHSLIPSGVEI